MVNTYGRMSPDQPWVWLAGGATRTLTAPRGFNDGRWSQYIEAETPPSPTWGQEQMGNT